MQTFHDKRVTVGQKLGKYASQNLGYGLYVKDDQIFASVMGTLKQEHNRYFIQSKIPTKCIGLCIGDIVYCQVTKIKEDQAFVSIIQISYASLNKAIQASIRKQHVREKLVDQVVMADSFRPGDYIKAKIISLGDSLRNLYLTTAGEDLGVLVSKNQKTDNLMLPFDWESMVDPTCNQFEKRKVAKPQI